jgi:hypothetical protein
MNLHDTLTKENFWNDIMKEFPEEMNNFCEWIDEYKAEVQWTNLFSPGIKFHDIPYEMQQGIWLEYVCQQGGCQYEIEDFFEFDLRKEIRGYFNAIHVD